ncbi:MAG: hypothetical protein HFE49_07010 [Clostridia bacterium]|nr:hypothetical protein [Clostridia bacterium]
MLKKQDIIITAMFCGFIGIMAVCMAFLPKKTISENEKRSLAEFPAFSVGKMFKGTWETEFENYISDHFPARNLFTAIDSYYMLYTGRNGSKGVYKGEDGYLLNTPVKCDDEKLCANIQAVNEFAKKTSIKTKLMIVPSAGYVMEDKLPTIHEQYNDAEIIYTKTEKMLESGQMIDLVEEFKRSKDSAQLYYKTDHHWTSEGAYIAYRLWAAEEGLDVRGKSDYTIETAYDFYGTAYTKSALWNEKSDKIEIWEYPANVRVFIENKEYDSMFFREHLNEQDKYPVFLDGNHGFERIINNSNINGKKILVIKDSYAHAFVPFMAENCSQIDMVDLRYYFDRVSKLAENNVYDEVLVLYGISSLCEANDLSILK